MAQRFDIIVSGAGMVGACCALAMARQGYSVAIIEPSEIPAKELNDDGDYDLRVSAVSPASQRFLSELGVWQALNAGRICEYEKMFVWHEHGKARIEFDCAEVAQASLGAIVENRQVVHALRQACEQQANIEWFNPDHIVELAANTERAVSVQLSSHGELTSDLLVAADGRGSATRELAGLHSTGGDYGQRAIVANIDTELPHSRTAWQRFLSSGPLAFLPLANGQCSIVWSCDDALAEQLIATDDEEFCRQLSDAFEFKLGRVQSTGARQSFPLGWHYCEQWLENRILLVGDAAHGVHPLAGQGVNLGFGDVQLLAQKIGPLDNAWNWKALRQFERQRKSETLLATQVFSGLKWIYGTDSSPLNRLRDTGMRLLQANPVCRRSLIQQAMRNMA